MKKVGSILVLLLLLTAVTSAFAAVYYFTQIETEKTKVLELKAELRDFKARGRATPVAADGGASAGTSIEPPRMETSSSAPGVVITVPAEGQSVGSPMQVAGRAITFGPELYVRVRDATGKLLGEGTSLVSYGSAGDYGNFSAELEFVRPETATGTVEVFELSVTGGRELNTVAKSVSF